MNALDRWVRAGVLQPLDAQMARALAKLGEDDDPLVELAAAMASRQVRLGHVCLSLDSWLGTDPAALVEVPSDEALDWPERASLERSLARSPLVQRLASRTEPAPDNTPLVWDGRDLLYLQRYFDHEQRLAQHVATRAAPLDGPQPDMELVEKLFPRGQRDEQRQAALGALGRRFAVITGGPGTGKTSTVVRLLALYLHTRMPRFEAPARVWLLAPTGKAAARLAESIATARDELLVDAEVRDAIPGEALTIHRALGLQPGRYGARHHADNPLDADLVLVDEASMVDLSVMRRLLDAVPEHAPLWLLGDAHQLASVEAGAALGDLVQASQADAPALQGAVHALTRSHRYAPDSGIAALAEACREGDHERALEVLQEAGHPDIHWHATDQQGALPRELTRALRQYYGPLAKHDLTLQLQALQTFRVLCAHRRGPLGVEHVNREAATLARAGAGAPQGDYHGRPILITENDAGQGLYNGDVGVVHRPPRKGRLQAYFPLGGNERRAVSMAHLPAHESVYAMSVHKSQGSEFDHVAVLLPARISPVLSRELLYTAITRARRSVTLFANPEVLRHTLSTRVQRASGLVRRLSDT